MIPTRIDSHGNPGIPGSSSVLLLNTVDTSVLVLVAVRVETVLLMLVADCVRTFVAVDVRVVEALTVGPVSVELALVSVNVELPTVTVVVDPDPVDPDPPLLPETGGYSGSKWNIPASGTGGGVIPEGPAPTAHPSCVLPDCPYTEFSASPTAIGGEIVVAVQICPSQ
jgi:hypothetical protein